jgi:hypothetical protein
MSALPESGHTQTYEYMPYSEACGEVALAVLAVRIDLTLHARLCAGHFLFRSGDRVVMRGRGLPGRE